MATACLVALWGAAVAAAEDWRSLAPGVELTVLTASQPSSVGDSRITVVRVDPGLWQLRLVGRSLSNESEGQTAREWARSEGLVIAINAGMFGTDHVTHLGFMGAGEHLNNGHVNDYRSVAAFDPRYPGGRPPFRIFDLDAPDVTMDSIRRDYASAVQNLRLIKRPRENRWGQQNKRWSEAALGEDESGRILFLHCRSPFSMHDLNRELLSAGIGLVAAQHLEGGPEAQLYVNLGGVELELIGSFETAFREDDGNALAWPVPNVLGVLRKAQPE